MSAHTPRAWITVSSPRRHRQGYGGPTVICAGCRIEFVATGKGGRCPPCRSEYEKAWRAKRKAAGNPVVATKMPPDYFAAYNVSYKERAGVRIRKAAQMRDSAARHPVQTRARRLLRSAIERGDITRAPCEQCGSTPAHGHHDDYSKPLAVRWLCRKHHDEHHAKAEGAA